MAVMFALVLALVLSGLVALVGDLILIYDAAGRFDNGALVGAQAGASQVDVIQLREGTVVLDNATATRVCEEAAAVTAGLGSGGRQASCAVSPDGRSVRATVRANIPLVFASHGPAITISRSHTGTVAVGESRGDTAP
ncbi:MAG: hypothetical protein ABR573_08790 [Candidatus Dormibacteria bacterium]